METDHVTNLDPPSCSASAAIEADHQQKREAELWKDQQQLSKDAATNPIPENPLLVPTDLTILEAHVNVRETRQDSDNHSNHSDSIAPLVESPPVTPGREHSREEEEQAEREHRQLERELFGTPSSQATTLLLPGLTSVTDNTDMQDVDQIL